MREGSGTGEPGVLVAAARDAPRLPGVYLFLGGSDEVLYVGKATRLRDRLRQHARPGPRTSHLHRRYDLVRRVVWEVAESEEAAAWREADVIFAVRPPYNADPGLRFRDPLGGAARPPFLVVREGIADTLHFALDPEPAAAGARVYGCFPHLGKGVASQLGIACSDGYVALLRLVWAASDEGTHAPASITRSAAPRFQAVVAAELRPGLHRLLSGMSANVVGALLERSRRRPPFMAPGLAHDGEAALRFFAAGPHLVRTHRLRGGVQAASVDADTYRRLVIQEIEGAMQIRIGDDTCPR